MKYAKKLHTTGLVLGVLSTFGLITPNLNASDHQEAPGTSAQLVADIGDYYAWHEGDDLNLVLTFGTFAAPGAPASFDSTILYGFHFDTSVPADGIPDLEFFARFAQDVSGNYGVQLIGLGESPLEGPVDTILSNSDLTLWSGVADDPFFFDQTGFNETVATGVLSFDPTRDDVAGLNVTAIAMQVPLSTILTNGSSFETWATTGSL